MKNRVILLSVCFLLSCETFKIKKENETSDEVLYKLGDPKPVLSPVSDDLWSTYKKENSLRSLWAENVTGESQRAEIKSRNFLKSNPNNLEGFESLARALIARKKTALAAHYASYVLEKDPKRTQIKNVLGLVQAFDATTNADYLKAKKLFYDAYTSTPSSLAAGLNLAHLELETGAISNAKNLFEAISQKCGRCGPALLGLGIAERRMGQIKTSIQTLKESRSSREVYHVAGYHLALSLKKQSSLEDARSLLNEIIDETRINDDMLRAKSRALLYQVRIEMDAAAEEKNQL